MQKWDGNVARNAPAPIDTAGKPVTSVMRRKRERPSEQGPELNDGAWVTCIEIEGPGEDDDDDDADNARYQGTGTEEYNMVGGSPASYKRGDADDTIDAEDPISVPQAMGSIYKHEWAAPGLPRQLQ